MDLSQFPLEILEVLAHFLSPSDLSACSAVSVPWRDAFNLDLFWRRHCLRRVASYLQRHRALVDPLFQHPACVDTLEPVCDWRVRFMRQSHLLRNWSKGHYMVEKMDFPSSLQNFALGMDASSNHWLVVNLGDRTEVWDVQTMPTFHAVVGNITSAPSYLDIVGDKLIIVDFFYFVQVFHLKLPTMGFVMSSKFFYTDPYGVCVDLANDEDRNEVRNRCRANFRKGHVLFIMDDLLIGYCSYVDGPKEQFLHIWNIGTESKLSEETVVNALRHKLKPDSCNAYISSDLETKQLLCSLYLLDKFISKLVIYSVKRKEFTDFSVTVSGKVDWCDISGGWVATSHLLHQLHIYSSVSGNLVHILDTNTKIFFGPSSGLQYQIMGQYMIQPSRESVKVINIENHWDSLLLYFYSVYKVIPLPPYYVAVSARPYVSSNKMTLEVWDVRHKVRLFDHIVAESECPTFHMIQAMLTKSAIAVGKTVKVLSFW